jgi:hypothetical protein
MRLPNTVHTSRPWRIHEIAPDLKLEDVWELPGRGGPDDFPRLVQLIASFDPVRGSSRVSRALWPPDGRSGGCSAGMTPTAAWAPGSRRCATGCLPIWSAADVAPTSPRSRSRRSS